MNIMSLRQAAVATFVLAVAYASTTAYSQSNVASAIQAKLAAGAAKLEASCGDEIKSFCSTVTPGGGRVVLCIEAHEDKLSPKCLFDMTEAGKNLKITADTVREATSACRGDLGKLCGSVQVGQGRVMQCLMTNKASVIKACADSLRKLSDFSEN
jgi:hypothetical protein